VKGPRALGPVKVPWRRLLRDFSSVLIIAGVLMLLDAVITLVWQEPVTAVIGLVKRDHIDRRYLSYEEVPLTAQQRRALASFGEIPERIAFLARRLERQVPAGAALGRLRIARLGLDDEIVQGTDLESLEEGPGHYPATALPGLGQTVAIAGHRTTYLAPFQDLDKLAHGDRIIVSMPYARFTYEVQYQRIVTPTSWWITDNVGYDRLVLSACNPLYSAAQRIVVFARLVATRPTQATLRG
jgi:sortase A